MQNVSAEQAYAALDQPGNIFIDVRTPGEFAAYHVQGAINLPLDDIADTISSAVTDKSSNIYLYCLSGSRSIEASQVVKQLGYTNLFNIQSGLLAWRSKNLPLVAITK